MAESVILVDENDQMVGTMEKLRAHFTGSLHRAFSIFIFNTNGDLLLQQRAIHKYHSGGKWTNTCCSHPRLGEDTKQAAHRRLNEEMRMECVLNYAFSFIYRSDIQDGIIEHEYDHVFVGVTNSEPIPSAEEVAAFKYMSMQELATELELNAACYTEWLKICFSRVMEHYNRMLTQGVFSEVN